MSLGAAFSLFAGLYYRIGKNERPAISRMDWKTAFLGDIRQRRSDIFSDAYARAAGMPRQIIEYPEAFADWNFVSSISAYLSAASFVFGLSVFTYTLLADGTSTKQIIGETAQRHSNGSSRHHPLHGCERLPRMN
jgi:cytochrome c oxidase subunit 1